MQKSDEENYQVNAIITLSCQNVYRKHFQVSSMSQNTKTLVIVSQQHYIFSS